MEYYIEAIRDTAAKCEPCKLKNALDFLMDCATEDYKGGALDVVEFGDILNEYTDTVRNTNAVNYI